MFEGTKKKVQSLKRKREGNNDNYGIISFLPRASAECVS